MTQRVDAGAGFTARLHAVVRSWALMLALSLASGLAPTAAAAQTKAPLVRVGVFSLLGDTVQATWSDDRPRDTRIERTGRDNLDFKGIGFDLIALRAARAELARQQPAPAVDLFAAPVPVALSDQRAVATGAERAELPDWIARAVNDNRLSHVLLVTRSRGTIDARTSEGYGIGRGTVEGIGLYIDTLYEMLNKSTGAVSTGLLAPYVQIRLQLMEVQTGNIVADYAVRDAFAYAAPDPKLKAEPWDFMPNTQKVRALRGMVEEGMTRGMQALLKGGQ